MSRSRTQATPIQATKLQQEAEKLGQILEKIREERAELREETRKAHEALKDLAHATSEAGKFIVMLTEGSVKKMVYDAVEKGLDEYKDAQLKAMRKGEQSVYDRFDLIATLCLGEDYNAASGGPPVDELIRRYMKASRVLASGEVSIVAGSDEDLTAFVKPDIKPGEIIP